MIDRLLGKKFLPDHLVRLGLRRRLARRLREATASSPELQRARLLSYVENLKRRPIAENTRAANGNHGEAPVEFYQLVLGPRLKYSCCLYPRSDETLAEAEEKMLALYAERARLADGQHILDLGCGWGSLSLWLAEKFPRAHITGVSHSRPEKEFIDAEAHRRGLRNLDIRACDMNTFDIAPGQFDRVVSIEMFEYMKNYRLLLANIARWLKPGGLLFAHLFTHKTVAYHFVTRSPDDWIIRHFFADAQMTSDGLLTHFQNDLKLIERWSVNGTHYQKTARHWLENMDAHRAEILPLFAKTYGPRQAKTWWAHWRIFFMACAELWGYRKGEEWLVSHYLFEKPAR